MDELEMLGIRMYPNPSFGEITLQAGDDQIEQVRIFDAAGRLVYDLQSNETKMTIDLSTVSPGMYMVEIRTQDGQGRAQLIRQ
ncbi:MAG: hypothetical protein A3D92_12060 [Bacteroidetes bacterium RIFCSPHIGHO2_02_FULL_44_7]|nr:MAG: hypothetical protein A3D92_12060 [Bacteroidetes bacterium RIFCSPHIGHO2_02_FULL_44_7]